MKKKIISFFTLIILLAIVSFNFISIKGKEYVLRINNHDFSNTNINDVITFQEGQSVSLIDKKIDDKDLLLKYRAVMPGKSSIEIKLDNYHNYYSLFVNHFGIVSLYSYFGDVNGDEVIPISLSILTIVLILFVYDSYKRNIKKNMYQYKNIYLLGLIIFLLFLLLSQITNIFDYKGSIDTINKYIGSFNYISFVLLPIGFIIFIFVSISNFVLIKKEGFSPRNMLGIILGLFLGFVTILPDIMYKFTFNSWLINIHNVSTVSYHIYTFFETLIYSIVVYLECILIAVIVLGIKSSKRIPEFNKDYIIILGCMINKDGSLTNLLKGRVDKAIEFSKMQKERTNKDITFITSGGKGNDEPISEGLAMKNYLVKNKIDENKIIVEDKSTDTFENFKFSMKKIKNKKNVAYSTTNFHVFRAGVEASKLGLNVEGIGSKTKRYFWINAFIREFIATIYYERKNHLIIFGMILLINALMILILYISNLF